MRGIRVARVAVWSGFSVFLLVVTLRASGLFFLLCVESLRGTILRGRHWPPKENKNRLVDSLHATTAVRIRHQPSNNRKSACEGSILRGTGEERTREAQNVLVLSLSSNRHNGNPCRREEFKY